jgi:hypothetical protein
MTAATREAQAEPIVIYATRGFDSYTFALDADCRDELVAQSPTMKTLPRRVTIALDVVQSFRDAFGPVLDHVIPLLTNRTLDDLRPLGGIEVRDPQTDQVLWSAA